jgi:archaellum component FlaC
MKMKRKMAVALTAMLLFSAFAAAAQQAATSSNTSRKKPAKASGPTVSEQLKVMQNSIQAQQQQIQQLTQQLQGRDAQIRELQQEMKQVQSVATEAQQKADTAGSTAAQEQGDVAAVKSEVSDLKSNVTNTALSLQETQKNINSSIENPLAIHYKGVNITPGGFVAAETVTRQRGLGSDINTPFNSIPYPGNALAKINESNFTARQSRLSLLGESKVGAAKLTGYWEADFLGAGVTSNNRQSNSYVLRQRILYGQAALDNGWIFTGGQQWSLATETRTGITNRTEVLPQTIDSQYQVGFNWARQYGFRVVKDFGGKFALGFAVEAPQATIGGRGFSTVTTTDLSKSTVTTTGNAFVDGPGSGGGLFNFVDTSGYSFNKSPDIIAKAVADPGWGHYELFGIFSQFRNRVYPCGVVGTNAKDTTPPATPVTVACPIDGSTSPSAIGAFNDTRNGGGFGANIRVPVVRKKLDFAVQGAAGDGIGRYGSAQIADLTLRPDGTQALIRTAHALGELELHATPKLDIYAYFGGEYGWRTAYTGYDSIAVLKTPAIPATATTAAVPATTTTTIKLNQIGGYGSPFANNSGCSTENPPTNQLTPSSGGSCAGDTRLITEGTIGFWHRLTQGPKGGLRWGIQYSYFERLGWSGYNGTTGPSISPKGVDNMVWTSFRYYLP